MTSAQLKTKYRCPVYRKWEDVPAHMHTRTSALREKVVIPKDAKATAIKNAATTVDRDKIYLLYDIRKYDHLPHSRTK